MFFLFLFVRFYFVYLIFLVDFWGFCDFRKWLVVCKRFVLLEEVKFFCLDVMEMEINLFEKVFFKIDEKIGFCYNDLQYGNIMMDEEIKVIIIIVRFLLFVFFWCCIIRIWILIRIYFIKKQDYEYFCYNFVVYDIVNYFCEMVVDYYIDIFYIMDYIKYFGK